MKALSDVSPAIESLIPVSGSVPQQCGQKVDQLYRLIKRYCHSYSDMHGGA